MAVDAMWTLRLALRVAALVAALARPAAGQRDSTVEQRGDSVSIRLVDVDLRFAVQALARYLDRPVVFGSVAPGRVTVETPQPVPRARVSQLLGSLLESQGLELEADTVAGIYRVRARAQPVPLVQPEQRPAGGPGVGGEPVQLHVIRLSHARAADVAATVNALYGRASALGEIGERRSTLSDELRRHQVPAGPPAGGQPGEATGVVGGRPAQLAGEVTIIPDAGTNSLLVRASAPDYELIRAAVGEIDVRPLQVLIEVLITEVRRDRAFAFGVEGKVPRTTVPGTDGTVAAEASQAGVGLGDFVLRVMRSGPGLDFDATLRAAASRGDVSIVSRPIVIAANNEPAEITVGSQRPFVQVQRSLPTDAPSRDQVVQYKDVGTRLMVRPTISADGYVMLEVAQEVNAATSETQFDAPVISTRSVQTRLLIRDGQTVALGGLVDRQRDRNQGGVPILSGLPLLGGLFGRASRRATDTELLLFITPRVLRSDEDAEGVTRPLRTRAGRARP